ncbi:pilus assembly protein [Faucicola boevrei]|uniref:PilC/PilY family type IV pilus protein n=1 Tax=Faucicola boevrei TaxID=346665 RepID=UPI000378E4B9|nr:PilC/PilY family type IV pilus protein [Moraxella boevrei]
MKSKINQKILSTSLKYLVVAMAMTGTSVTIADVNKKEIGDLEIYKPAQGGSATIAMMLDISGSMLEIDLPDSTYKDRWGRTRNQPNRGVWNNGLKCLYNWRNGRFAGQVTADTVLNASKYTVNIPITRADGTLDSTISMNVEVCPNTKDGRTNLEGNNTKNIKITGGATDRITNLKLGLVGLLADGTALSENHRIAMGSFPTPLPNVIRNPFKYAGNMQVPAERLTLEHRKRLINYVLGLRPNGGTPIAHAYPEVASYMLGGTTQTNAVIRAGGGYGLTGFPESDASTKNGNVYKTPLNPDAQCEGYGIYFLTDGAPNASGDNSAPVVMGAALGMNRMPKNNGRPQLTNANTESPTQAAWDWIGNFSQVLRTKNQFGKEGLKTATVGFGKVFDGFTNKTVTIDSGDGKTEAKTIPDCNSVRSQDAKNLCLLGSLDADFGKGGFTATGEPKALADSVVNFISSLNQELPSSPSGTITVPDDPYRVDSQQAIAYLPMVEAKVAENPAVWAGNVKKYALDQGTLYGQNNNKLFNDEAGSLNTAAADLWSPSPVPSSGNANISSGGMYARLTAPNAGLGSGRTLYIEDFGADGRTPVIRKFGVNASGKVTLDNNVISNTNRFRDTTTYTEERAKKLLHFLGFDNLPNTGKILDGSITLTKPTNEVKILGGAVHSNPVSVSYAATLDDYGQVTGTRDDYVLFGSMDGALHLVNADNATSNDGGKEQFAFIPKSILQNQDEALKGTQGTGKAIGVPYFGIDAPWMVHADYKFDIDNNKVTVETAKDKGVFAYGGMRMGGEGLYGLKLTNKTTPELMFYLSDKKSDGTPNADFQRMGQIWAKPVRAKIKTSNTDKGTDVLVFGGGYDMKYESEDFVAQNAGDVKGNAVYIVNAHTGALIWSASGSAGGTANTSVPTMKNSVVAGVTILDRNNDGFMDHLYFADLGGQIFRADFTNAGDKTYDAKGVGTATTSFKNQRVTRILQPAFSESEAKYAHRFYERPVVSIYRGDNTFNNGRLFALVNAISGDRSSPLSKMRSDNKYADRVIGIMDTDVTKANSLFYATDFTTRKEKVTIAGGGTKDENVQKIKDLTDTDFANIPTEMGNVPTGGYTEVQKNTGITAVKAKKGWYYPLVRFDGYNNVKYTKGVGKSEVINSFLYTTTYNPDMKYGSGSSCAASIAGGSERQLYCLPYGICKDVSSKSGTGGFARAGQGIQELTLGPLSSSKSNTRLLVGTRTIQDRVNDRVDYGQGYPNSGLVGQDGQRLGTDGVTTTGGDGSIGEFIFNERFTLQPVNWYEINNAKD